MTAPYRTTPVFDQATLPAALLAEHRTKEGVWGVIRVLEGRLRLTYVDEPGGEVVLDPATPGRINPQQAHFVAPLGEMRMQVEFYDRQPDV